MSDSDSNISTEEAAPAPSLPNSSMHITVKIPHCDHRVVTDIYMLCDSFAWHQLSQYDWVFGQQGYVHVRHNHCKSFHRMAFAILHPHTTLNPTLLVDHKSKQKLDCRAINLRLTDHKGNAQNRGKRSTPRGFHAKGSSPPNSELAGSVGSI